MAGKDISHAALVDALRAPGAYAHPVDTVEVIETHISSVLLAGDFAYKIKKPVNLGFADFSTLERRRAFCDEEIRLNRRSAPSLYLDVVPVTRSADGVRIGGDGPVLDYAVRMRRFSADARLDQRARAGTLDAGVIDRLAAAVAAFHARCAPAPDDSAYGTAQTVRAWTTGTVAQLQAQAPASERQRVDRLAAWIETEFARCAQRITARRAAGFVRECHGDLHLANVALVDGEPVPFDCIEFNPELRFIDVISDVAFTWMDLLDHALPRLAARFLNGYLEANGDHDGVATLRFHAVYRALVRALVATIRAAQLDHAPEEQARQAAAVQRYLEVAERLTRIAQPILVIVGGVTGSGKTTVARHLLEHLGAVCVRSDVERKRQAGLAATARTHDRIDAGLYAAAATRATYQQLVHVADTLLSAGFSAIVDATFQRRDDRRAFAALAAQRGARFALVLCAAPAATLQARVAARSARGDDASDATAAVLAQQLATFEAPTPDEAAHAHHLDTDTDAATLAARCAALAGQLA
jgi:aminoglycoside phosphotransferase family enzyme/predicted kinase